MKHEKGPPVAAGGPSEKKSKTVMPIDLIEMFLDLGLTLLQLLKLLKEV